MKLSYDKLCVKLFIGMTLYHTMPTVHMHFNTLIFTAAINHKIFFHQGAHNVTCSFLAVESH